MQITDAAPQVTGAGTEGAAQAAAESTTENQGQKASETPQDQDTVKKLSILAKREKEILDMRQELARQKAELEKHKLSLDSEYTPLKTMKEKLEKKDWSALKDIGFDYNGYTQFLLNGEKEPVEQQLQRMREEIRNEIKAEIGNKEKEIVERQTQAQKDAEEKQIQTFKTRILDELRQDFQQDEPQFQWLSAQDDPQELVYEVIAEHYRKTGEQGNPKVLSTTEAAELVEKHLENEYKTRFKKVKKARTLVDELFKPPEPPPGKKLSQAERVTSYNTLTNDMPPTQPQALDKTRPFNRYVQDSISEAAKLIKFK